MKPLALRKLEREIKERGFTIETYKTDSHRKVVSPDGQTIATYAVKHGKGQKKEVKGYYVQNIRKKMDEYTP